MIIHHDEKHNKIASRCGASKASYDRRRHLNCFQTGPALLRSEVSWCDLHLRQSTYLEYLNSRHPTIKFDLELSSEEGFLPLLDMAVQIDETGNFQRKPFTKKANKGIVLNFSSDQPASVKRALVKSEIQRAHVIPTDKHTKEALDGITNKLQNNGYPRDWIMQSFPPNQSKGRRTREGRKKTDLCLWLPFTSDQFNHGAKQLLEKHKITARLVNQRGTTLSDLTKKRKKPVQVTARASYAPHRRSAEKHTLFTWQLVIDAERDTLAWQSTSFMLGPLNIYERQINVKNTRLLVTITRQDTRKRTHQHFLSRSYHKTMMTFGCTLKRPLRSRR